MWNLLKINNKYTKTTSLTAFIREIGVLFSGRLKQGIKSVNGGNHKFVNRLKLFSGKNQVLVNDFFTCAYQNMRNVSFLGHFVYVLNEWSLWLNIPSTQPALTPKQCSIPPNSQENLCFNQVADCRNDRYFRGSLISFGLLYGVTISWNPFTDLDLVSY